MKKSTVLAFVAAAAIAFGCATASNAPDRLSKFVEKTEQEYKDYTEEDWKKSREEYDALVEEMKANYENYTTEENLEAAKAMSRYNSMLLENGVAEASESLSGMIEQLPTVINDLIENIDTSAIQQSIKSFGSSLEGLINSIDTAAIRKTIEGVVGSVDTAKIRKSIEGMAESIDTAALRRKIEGLARSVDTATINKTIESIIRKFGLED